MFDESAGLPDEDPPHHAGIGDWHDARVADGGAADVRQVAEIPPWIPSTAANEGFFRCSTPPWPTFPGILVEVSFKFRLASPLRTVDLDSVVGLTKRKEFVMEACYEYLGCPNKACVMFRIGRSENCWQVEGTLCNHHAIGVLRSMSGAKKEAVCARSGCIYYEFAKKREKMRREKE